MTDAQKITDAFHLMWDNYPESVMLIRKDRTIIAVNRAGALAGREAGTKCSTLQPLENHKGCKADECAKNHSFTYRKKKGNLGDTVSFWLPVDGYPEYIVHFSVGGSMKYEYTV
ncbi:MAG: hypothetical protein LBM00_00335 [Deltaproteobacteria bacterium]|jgi:hypothetical protein|nr:hypothetical protein [Deltaproteobacteria bacterium]